MSTQTQTHWVKLISRSHFKTILHNKRPKQSQLFCHIRGVCVFLTTSVIQGSVPDKKRKTKKSSDFNFITCNLRITSKFSFICTPNCFLFGRLILCSRAVCPEIHRIAALVLVNKWNSSRVKFANNFGFSNILQYSIGLILRLCVACLTICKTWRRLSLL